MKSLFAFFAAMMVSGSVWAWPNVGDRVNYDLTAMANGQMMTGEMSIAVQSTNPSLDAVELFTSFTIAGQSRTQISTSRLSDLHRVATSIPAILVNCQGSGGVPEVVATASGNFQTCKVPSNNGFTWLADVKFGWVKIDQVDPSNGMRTIALFRNQN